MNHRYDKNCEHRAGELAYLDSFHGMIPVKVTKVIKPGTGTRAAPKSGEIEFRLTVTRGGYRKGEVLTDGAHNVVPRSHRYLRNRNYVVNPQYRWVV